MTWHLSHRADIFARWVADRHYNRQKIGTPQFVPPGRCAVLYGENGVGRAVWVTSWPFAEFVKHAWPGAWVCSAFRNEGVGRSSDMIREAVAHTRFLMGEPPELGMVTFVDPRKVAVKKTLGYCYVRAGFRPCGETKGGLKALRLCPSRMPPAAAPSEPFYPMLDGLKAWRLAGVPIP